MKRAQHFVLMLVDRFQYSYRHLYMMFLTVFALPLILTVALTETSVHELERQMQASISTVTRQAQATVDSNLRDINLLIEQINNHATLRYLLNCKPPLTNSERYMALSVIQDLRKIFQNHSFVRAVFVYEALTDTVVSSYTQCDSLYFYNNYYRYGSMDYEQWRGEMTAYHSQRIWPAQTLYADNVPVRCLTVLQTLPRGETYRVMGTLMILIDESWMLNHVAAARELDSMAFSFFIMDAAGNRVLASDSDAPVPDVDTFETAAPGAAPREDLRRERIDGVQTILSYRASTERDWFYVIRAPVARLFGIAIRLRTTFRVALVAVLLAGAALAGLLAYMSFLPARGVLSALRGGAEKPVGVGTGAEFTSGRFHGRVSFLDLGKLMEQALRDNSAYQEQLPLFIENCVFRLVHGGHDIQPLVSMLNELLGFQFPSQTFCVMCFHLPAGNAERADAAYAQASEAVRQARGFPDAGMNCYAAVATEDTVAILASMHPGLREDNRSALLRQADRIMRIFQKNTGYRRAVGIGQMVHGYEMINDSYRQAVICITEASSHESVTFYADIAGVLPPMGYDYSLDKEKVLIGCVCTGDSVRAAKIVRELFMEWPTGERLSPDALAGLKYDLLGTLFKCVQAMRLDENTAHREKFAILVRSLKHAAGGGDVQTMLLGAFEWLCEQANYDKPPPRNTLVDRVVEFIRQSYTNPELGLNTAARAFNIAPPYLSRLFKEHTGGNFIDYLNQLRVEKAAHLLRTTNLTHEEIARCCGVSGAQTLNRMFNRSLAISPKVYRQMAQDGKLDERSEWSP